MKTIVCGPPHSGKSVFIANLVKFMPSDSYLRINANGDGEGTWSNNLDQKEVMSVREKTASTPEEFVMWEKQIRDAVQDIVLIDIGGRLQDDKGPLFDAADSFIVLSSDPAMVDPWIEFGTAHGCRCLAAVESHLDGKDAVYSTEPFLRALVCGLERGSEHFDSVALKAVADVLVRTSGYMRTEFVDCLKIGEELGCAVVWETSDGMPVSHVHFRKDLAPKLHYLVSKLYSPFCKYRILNLKLNWVAAIMSDVLGHGDLSRVAFYDDWTGGFVVPVALENTVGENPDLECVVEETEDSVFLSIKSREKTLSLERFREYRLPVINENKPLFLSGRFPTWFTVAVLGSYSSKEQYVLQPGNHFICVRAEDVSKLGSVALLAK